MDIFLSYVSACPFSSNAITITAAPKSLTIFAWLKNSSSPFFKEIEFTIGFPWILFKPVSITSHIEESIIIGLDDISGSAAISLKKYSISFWLSSKPSSKFISMIWAPFSTCSFAIDKASS